MRENYYFLVTLRVEIYEREREREREIDPGTYQQRVRGQVGSLRRFKLRDTFHRVIKHRETCQK
jgi:hypothetical protein